MKGFKKKQVLEAIKNSDYTFESVAKYLAEHFSPDGKCDGRTAKEYIEKYGAETKNAFQSGALSLRDMSVENIKKALKRGDVKTSKWVLERIDRGVFGEQKEEDTAESSDTKFQFIIIDQPQAVL